MSFQAQLAQASEEQRRKLREDPRLFTRNSWNHPNDQSRDYDFRTTDGDTKLNYLLDDEGPLNPEQWGGINIFLMARGLLKTTTMQMILNWAFQFYGPEGLEAYMAAPREDQYEEFVEKFRTKLGWSGLDQYRPKNALSHQKFKFDLSDRTTYAHFKADSGWGSGDAMRGPHSHIGIFDEFQDATPKAFNAGFYEVIDQSIADVPHFPVMFLMGTPKLEGSFFEEMWKRSDQREWCPDEGESGSWIRQDEPQTYGTGDDTLSVHGWHIDQPTAPLHSEAQIEAKRDMKKPQEFVNEVLAEFYSPEDHLLAEQHLDAVTDPAIGFISAPRDEDNYVTIGIDWGGGTDRKAADTVIAVMEHVTYENGMTESIVDNVDFLDESLSKDEEMDEVEKRLIQFQPDRVVVDDGYGTKRREDLQDGNNTIQPDGYDNVVGCRFGNISNVDKIKWKDKDTKQLFTADKSHVAKSFVDFVKAERLRIPSADIDAQLHGRDNAVGTKLYRQLTAPFEERKETATGRKTSRITSKSGSNDDAFDAFNYAFLAFHADKLGPTNTPTRFTSTNVPGAR